MKVKSESEVAQSCPTPSDPMDCSLPGSSIHEILQARVLEWGAIAFSGPFILADSNFIYGINYQCLMIFSQEHCNVQGLCHLNRSENHLEAEECSGH